MPIVNRLAGMQPEIAEWRRDLHAHPEVLYEVHRTAASVAEKLKGFGCDEVVTGIGQTGVVGVIHGARGRRENGKVIGMRADMDALPIHEQTGLAYQSTVPGKMHACGHDGHTAMLLGAAKYLAETRNFAGSAVVIFQPAEEGGAGGRAMVQDGLMDRFGIHEVYGMHNYPGLEVGHFAIRRGAFLAAADRINITIEGRGGHAAKPHETVDPVVVAAQIISGVQSIVARNVDPLHSAVISICMVTAGDTYNVIPQRVTLGGTARTLNSQVQDLVEQRLREFVEATAGANGAVATLSYGREYPVMVNHPEQTRRAAAVAAEIAGAENVDSEAPPIMGAEDFAFMLNERPGALIFVGNGPSAGLHHPSYDFNDEAIPAGSSYWVRLVETLAA